jgi:hypothetical protein
MLKMEKKINLKKEHNKTNRVYRKTRDPDHKTKMTS